MGQGLYALRAIWAEILYGHGLYGPYAHAGHMPLDQVPLAQQIVQSQKAAQQPC